MTKSKGINRPRLNMPQDVTVDWLLQHTIPTRNGCREWQHSHTASGYGTARTGGRREYVHRIVCGLVYGPPKPGQEVLHSCDNPPCITPEHLRWGSHLENMQEAQERDRVQKRTGYRGPRHHSSKLSYDEADEIRRLRARGATLTDLGRKYGVHFSSIDAIVRNRTWVRPEGNHHE